MVAFTWLGAAATTQSVVNAGPLALIDPLLDKLDIEAIIDRHLPPDPQLEYSHGQVLRVFLEARLCHPTALINVADWARKTGADIFSNIPADKLNDDRLGRSLDAFYEQRHSILGSATAQALNLTGLSLNRLHFDPTHLVFAGAYESSKPRPDLPQASAFAGDGLLDPAHICHGYNADRKMIRYQSCRPPDTELRVQPRELANARRRFGASAIAACSNCCVSMALGNAWRRSPTPQSPDGGWRPN